MKNVNEIFKKDQAYDNIKCHKKPGFHSLFRKQIFVKATREYGGPPTPSLFRVKFKKFSIGTVRFNYFPVSECF